jgi:hypothetical protein
VSLDTLSRQEGPYCIPSDSVAIPYIAQVLCNYLEEEGMNEKGLFLKPGLFVEVVELRAKFNTSIHIDEESGRRRRRKRRRVLTLKLLIMWTSTIIVFGQLGCY